MTDADGTVVSIIPAENDEDGYESVERKEQANAGKSKRWKQPLRKFTLGPFIEDEKMERGLPVVTAHNEEEVCGPGMMIAYLQM